MGSNFLVAGLATRMFKASLIRDLFQVRMDTKGADLGRLLTKLSVNSKRFKEDEDPEDEHVHDLTLHNNSSYSGANSLVSPIRRQNSLARYSLPRASFNPNVVNRLSQCVLIE